MKVRIDKIRKKKKEECMNQMTSCTLGCTLGCTLRWQAPTGQHPNRRGRALVSDWLFMTDSQAEKKKITVRFHRDAFSWLRQTKEQNNSHPLSSFSSGLSLSHVQWTSPTSSHSAVCPVNVQLTGFSDGTQNRWLTIGAPRWPMTSGRGLRDSGSMMQGEVM